MISTSTQEPASDNQLEAEKSPPGNNGATAAKYISYVYIMGVNEHCKKTI